MYLSTKILKKNNIGVLSLCITFNKMSITNRFNIKYMHLVATAKQNMKIDICGICRNSLKKYCSTCQINPEKKNDCRINIGKCKHQFHNH